MTQQIEELESQVQKLTMTIKSMHESRTRFAAESAYYRACYEQLAHRCREKVKKYVHYTAKDSGLWELRQRAVYGDSTGQEMSDCIIDAMYTAAALQAAIRQQGKANRKRELVYKKLEQEHKKLKQERDSLLNLYIASLQTATSTTEM
ncbi:MAG: hypothetical protein Q9190_002523 [Brigantiaea leucoxantha]